MRIDLPESLKSGGVAKPPVYVGSWCEHAGDTVVFESDGKQLYIASGRRLNEYSGQWDLILDLANVVQVEEGPFVRSSDDRFTALNAHVHAEKKVKSQVVKLAWADLTAPPADFAFWADLWAILPPKTCICCIGGHGRSGTCCTALEIATGRDYYTALAHVRSEHCSHAVESVAQEQYLHALWIASMMARVSDPGLSSQDRESLLTRLNDEHNNPPTCASSLAGKATSTGAEWQQDKDGSVWVKRCTKLTCIATNCRKVAHQSWVCMTE